MANELFAATTAGLTIYAVVMNSSRQFYNNSTTAFESFTSADWTNYAVLLSEIYTGTGLYEGNFPIGITASGTYEILYYSRVSSSPAISDTKVSQVQFPWNGTSLSTSHNVTVAGYAPGEDPASLILVTPLNKLITNSAGEVEVSNFPTDFLSSTDITNIADAILVSPADKLSTASGGLVNINMAQSVPSQATISSGLRQTVGDALNAARVQAFGNWAVVNNILTMYADDGVTIASVSTLNNVGSPTSRISSGP